MALNSLEPWVRGPLLRIPSSLSLILFSSFIAGVFGQGYSVPSPTTRWTNSSTTATSSSSPLPTASVPCNDYCYLDTDIRDILVWYPAMFVHNVATSIVSVIGLNGTTTTKDGTLIANPSKTYDFPPEVTSWDPNFVVVDSVNFFLNDTYPLNYPVNMMVINTVFNITADVNFTDPNVPGGEACVPRMQYKMPTYEEFSKGRYLIYESATFPPALPFTTDLGNVFHYNDQFLYDRTTCSETAIGGTKTGLVRVTATTVTSTSYINVPTPTTTTKPFCVECMMYELDFQVYTWWPEMMTNTVATEVVTIKAAKGNNTRATQTNTITPTTTWSLPADMSFQSQFVVQSTEYALNPQTTLTWPTTYISLGPSMFVDLGFTSGSGDDYQCFITSEIRTMTGTATEIGHNGKPKGLMWGFTDSYNSWYDIPGKPLHQFATDLPEDCSELALGPPPFYLVPVSSMTATHTVIEDDDGDWHQPSTTRDSGAVTLSTAPGLHMTEPASPAHSAAPIITKTPTPNRPQPPPTPTTIGNIPVTPNPGGVVIGTQTLPPGSAITVSNTRISLAPSGTAIVIGKTTVPFSLPTFAAPSHVLPFGGQTITADSNSAFTISGQVLSPGSQITVGGTIVSLASDGSVAVIGDSVIPLELAPTPMPQFYARGLPGTEQTLTINGVTVTIARDANGNYVYNGQVVPPGAAIVVGGMVVNLDVGGKLIVGGHTLTPGASAIMVIGTKTISLEAAKGTNTVFSSEGFGVVKKPGSTDGGSGSGTPASSSSSAGADRALGAPRVQEMGWVIGAFVALLGFL